MNTHNARRLVGAIVLALPCGAAVGTDSTGGTNDTAPNGSGASAGVGVWSHLGGTPCRRSRARLLPGVTTLPPLDAPEWIASVDGQSRPIFFLAPAGVVLDEARAYAVGVIDGDDHAIAFNRLTGEAVWTTPVPFPQFESWSTPALDALNRTLLVAAGHAVTAIRTDDGAVAWQATLNAPVVNASPVVTSDLGPADRCFVTDFPTTFGAQGRLYCINVDAFDAAENPYQPGDIVWSVPLGGQTSGNSPAYAGGRVFVATAGPAFPVRGSVYAFDAAATGAPAPEWTFLNTAAAGFFGGVTVSDGSVFASSYAFGGDEFGSNTVRLDAATGALQWSAPSNRTDAMPVVAQGRVFVSSGLADDAFLGSFGSFPTVQVFDAATGSFLWDLARETWVDTDGDGALDPGEFLSAGGWTIQPVATTSAAGPRLVVGSMPEDLASEVGPSDRLWVIDGGWDPSSDPFAPVLDVGDGAGSAPAYGDGWLYTIGPDGLYAYGPEGFAR